MQDFKNQNWKRYGVTVLFIAAPWAVRKLAKVLKPEYDKKKAQLEDYLDSKNGIKTNYQEHGFSVEKIYVKSDGEVLVKYSYEDRLNGSKETLSLVSEVDGESLETILVRDKKKKVTVTHMDQEGVVLEKDDNLEERFESVYTGANLQKYEQRWRLRNPPR